MDSKELKRLWHRFMLRRHEELEIFSAAPRYQDHPGPTENNVVRRKPGRKPGRETLKLDSAEGSRVRRAYPVDGVFRKSLFQEPETGGRDKLEARNSLKKMTAQDFTGELHDTQAAKNSGPLQNRKLVIQ